MSKTIVIRLIAILLSIAGLWIAFTQTQQPPVTLTMEKVKEDLYNIAGDGGNVAVLVSPEGVILVDDKFPRNVEDILAKVKTVSEKPVRYILNTHHHGDHTGGNEKLLPATEIIAHSNARANMVAKSQPGLPRLTFSEETTVFLGGKEVRARYFGRGHTNGDAIIYFPSLKVIHTGDLFVNGAPLMDYTSGASGVEWTRTLDDALKWDFDTVIPGHGPVSKRQDLINWKKSFETMRERLTELQRQNKPKEEVTKLLKIDDLPNWRAGATWLRSVGGLYDELAKQAQR